MNDKEKAESDQALAELTDSWPKMLFRFYKNCLDESFDKEQSLFLTCEFMKGLISSGKTKEQE